jgi:hypothetical protein
MHLINSISVDFASTSSSFVLSFDIKVNFCGHTFTSVAIQSLVISIPERTNHLDGAKRYNICKILQALPS